MFFGGTNWGYNTGCNEYLPLQTTYDYNAPIDEAGRTTPKYRALREILAKRTGRTLPEPPRGPARHRACRRLSLRSINRWSNGCRDEAGEAQTSAKPVTMEELESGLWLCAYRKTFPGGIKGTLELREARDYAVTMVNGKTVGKVFHRLGPDSNKITLDESGPATLDILVHNLGRISVITSANSQERARKGLIGGAFWTATNSPIGKSSRCR